LEDWLDYKPEQVIGENIAEVEFLPMESKSKVMEKFLQRISGMEVPAYELEFIARNGERRVGEIAVNVVRDEDGGVTHEIAMISDITERKEMTRMRDEFISTVSHEIRTPLTSIHLSLGLLAGGVAGGLPEQAMELVETAHTNSERLASLINDILSIERLESGQMEFNLQPLELTALAEKAIEENVSYAEQFGVEFVLESALPHARVKADSDRLMQVFTNLLTNAAKFSPPDDAVLVSVTRADEVLRVEITDHGSGIPESFHDRIFQKFAQADSSDTRQRSGTGLGLSIAKAIIERHGGRIGFETKANKGTTFYFKLPEWREETPHTA
jgi:PAS domain S-box-containing protein